MATYSCFWQVPRSEIFLQASLRQISDLLTLVSIYPAVKSDTLGTPPCIAVKKTKSYDFVQHQKPGTCFLMQASATTPIDSPDVWIFVLHGYVCVLLTSKTDTFLLCMRKEWRQNNMRNYTTQMDAARKGIITPEISLVAEKEHMDVSKLMTLVAEGKVAICANKNHTCLSAEGVGSMLRTKINVNLGVSRDCKDYDIEMKKVMSAVELGAEAIMDLSSHGNTQPFRRKLTSECPVMIGTVPVYDSVIHYQRDLATLTAKDFIDVIRMHAEDGVDFVTLHCGITRKTIEQIKKHKRKMNIVSRGGSLVFAWMSMTGEENPFYEYYDEILDICEEYDVTISLGDACRPGCLADATDVCQIEELVRLGELTKRAWDHNVQVMVEGPGHVPLDQVAANMKVQQSICMGAPFYVLGPLVTDIAPGYDHITAAIGGAVAAMNGAAFLCYVTPAEHLALPNVEDTKQGIIASKIAAHAADIAKGIPGARDIDDKMADARRVLDWDAQYACALDPETAKSIRTSRMPEDDHSDTCSMCGKFCAVRSMNKALAGEYIDIL